MHDPILARFHTIDPLLGKYPQHSPYAHCASNPLNFIDKDGADICILGYGDIPGHMAMLIQNEDEMWEYYSVNGIKSNELTLGLLGMNYNDVGAGEWDSPEAFFKFQQDLAKIGAPKDKSFVNFQYNRGYVIPCTHEQDAIMRDTFAEIAGTEYNVLNNNCAIAVQIAMHRAGLPFYNEGGAHDDWRTWDYWSKSTHTEDSGISWMINWIPKCAFNDIVKVNPNGRLIEY